MKRWVQAVKYNKLLSITVEMGFYHLVLEILSLKNVFECKQLSSNTVERVFLPLSVKMLCLKNVFEGKQLSSITVERVLHHPVLEMLNFCIVTRFNIQLQAFQRGYKSFLLIMRFAKMWNLDYWSQGLFIMFI